MSSRPQAADWRHVCRWDHADTTIRDGGGPTRVDTSDPDPTFRPRPSGFTAQLVPAEAEPLTWDGDNA